MMLNEKIVKSIIKNALTEDIGKGDITSQAIIDKKAEGKFHLITREDIVVCGIKIAEMIFKELDENIKFSPMVKEGEVISKKQIIASIEGRALPILKAERVALNLLQRMSGIATLTREFVNAVKDTNAKILDTRKTMPGLRILDKYAVKMGGGENHRMGLYDAILIKDNHIALAGGIKKAIEKAKKKRLPIEIECDTLSQVKEAIKLGVKRILLDNMKPSEIKKIVKQNPKVEFEVSGGITLDNVKEYAKTGVGYISIGALTHSARSVDIGLDML